MLSLLPNEKFSTLKSSGMKYFRQQLFWTPTCPKMKMSEIFHDWSSLSILGLWRLALWHQLTKSRSYGSVNSNEISYILAWSFIRHNTWAQLYEEPHSPPPSTSMHICNLHQPCFTVSFWCRASHICNIISHIGCFSLMMCLAYLQYSSAMIDWFILMPCLVYL